MAEVKLGSGDRQLASQKNMPLFPLRTVLFPEGILPLRIFEPRYVDMIRWCMRENSPFGVVLLKSGSDVMKAAGQEDQGPAVPDIFGFGTQAEIVDFNQADNGLLGIIAQGGRKFSVESTTQQPDGLLRGQVTLVPEEPKGEMRDDYAPLVGVLKDLMEHPLIQQLNLNVDMQQARSVSYRLAELLPIESEIKQALLQLNRPAERMAELQRLVEKFCQQ